MMNDKLIADMLAQLLQKPADNQPAGKKKGAAEQDSQLIDSVKAIAGQFGEPLGLAVNDFLGGKGELFETIQTAATSGGGSMMETVINLLTDKFNLNPTIASLLAGLLAKLLPTVGKKSEKETKTKTATRRKSGSGSVLKAIKQVASEVEAVNEETPARTQRTAGKPAAKKPAAKKTTTGKPAAKKTTTSKPAAKKPATPKTATKTTRRGG